ncbi:hypothetical protein SAMN06265377_0337 [Flagellimonas pacifica]|uniref:Uncharacterized protein n=2 Tax=Flagellimonas pacifica TaxID=1247520 RepID=A0A285MDY5_9FLAO|nr:hypothetical protein SAMN06265377_0337 [Allomuricauda parva]
MVRPIAPVIEYVINEDYIAEFLCINKDKIELQCNGKCYLMQRLSEQNEEKGKNLPKITLEEYPIGFIEITSCSSGSRTDHSLQHIFGYYNHYNYLFFTSSFHPPSIFS